MNNLLFPESPLEWQAWPCSVDVHFTLTPTTSVSQELFDSYRRDSWQEIAAALFDPANRDIFVGYQVRAERPISTFKWYASWPILRKGGKSCITQPESEGSPDLDDIIYAVWNRPNGTYGLTQTYMLTVGGHTKEEAEKNWKKCAIPFRRIYRKRRASSPVRAPRFYSN